MCTKWHEIQAASAAGVPGTAESHFAMGFQHHQHFHLKVEECGAAEVVDLVLREQFVTRLSERMVEWVQCMKAVQLAEDQLMACPVAGSPFSSLFLFLSLFFHPCHSPIPALSNLPKTSSLDQVSSLPSVFATLHPQVSSLETTSAEVMPG